MFWCQSLFRATAHLIGLLGLKESHLLRPFLLPQWNKGVYRFLSHVTLALMLRWPSNMIWFPSFLPLPHICKPRLQLSPFQENFRRCSGGGFLFTLILRGGREDLRGNFGPQVEYDPREAGSGILSVGDSLLDPTLGIIHQIIPKNFHVWWMGLQLDFWPGYHWKNFFCMCVCVCVGQKIICRSQFFLSPCGFWDGSQVVKLGARRL